MKPLKNSAAPSSPFFMKEYSLEPEREAQQLRHLEEKKFAQANNANGISRVIFFYGILESSCPGGSHAAFEPRKLQMSVLGLSIVI